MRIVHVVGARPNFMKAAPVMAAIGELEGVEQLLVHTGQHYDANMSRIFFKELGLPKPDVNLEVGSASHAVQTAGVMIGFEGVLLDRRPDWVVVYGDVNSTVAAALVATKLHISVAHVEAGLRSFDRAMPEELNRLVTDQLADLLFTPSVDGNENLAREGVPSHRIHLVGNVMIDTLIRLLPQAEARWPALQAERRLDDYALVTLHRPSNVDDPATLREVIVTLREISQQIPIIFPIHPRTRKRIADLDFPNSQPAIQNLRFHPPLGYLDFLALQAHARVVITDSGGIQEETTYLQVPCLTMRENTERPVTVTQGTNLLIGQDTARLRRELQSILCGDAKRGTIPPLWDGQAARRIAAILASGSFVTDQRSGAPERHVASSSTDDHTRAAL